MSSRPWAADVAKRTCVLSDALMLPQLAAGLAATPAAADDGAAGVS